MYKENFEAHGHNEALRCRLYVNENYIIRIRYKVLDLNVDGIDEADITIYDRYFKKIQCYKSGTLSQMKSTCCIYLASKVRCYSNIHGKLW